MAWTVHPLTTKSNNSHALTRTYVPIQLEDKWNGIEIEVPAILTIDLLTQNQ